MAGRISEYIPTTKITDTDLMDISVVDAGSASGYVTRKTTVSELINFHPSIYTDNGTLVGDRTVFQDDNTIYFNGGDFGLDYLNDGFKYEDLTKRVGIGTDTPLASTHIKGQPSDDILLLESSIGNRWVLVNADGQIGTGVGTNANIFPDFGQYHVQSGFNYGVGFYPTNCTVAGVTVQMKGTTDKGLTIQTQGGKTGSVFGLESTISSTGNTEATAVNGLAKNGSVTCTGVLGKFNGGGSILPSEHGVGVEGFAESNLDAKQIGVRARTLFNASPLIYTKDQIGIEASSGGIKSNNLTTSNVIAGKFYITASTNTTGDKISILSPLSDNDGVVVFGQDTRQGDAILQTTGGVRMQSLPTSAVGLLSGELWNDAGTLKIA